MIEAMKTTLPRRSQTKLPPTTILTLVLVSTLAALFVVTVPAQACGSYDSEIDLKKLAELAVSGNAAEAARAISALRARGAAGLAAFLAVHSEEIQRHAAVLPGSSLAPTNQPTEARWERLSKA